MNLINLTPHAISLRAPRERVARGPFILSAPAAAAGCIRSHLPPLRANQ